MFGSKDLPFPTEPQNVFPHILILEIKPLRLRTGNSGTKEIPRQVNTKIYL
jgi:hypothetical protein